jgi:hypothetical protein
MRIRQPLGKDLRFQEAISMTIDRLNGISIRNRDMVRLNANNLAVFLMGSIDSEVATPTTGLVHQPEIGKRGREGRGYPSNGIGAEIWEEVVEDRNEEEGPGREEG